MPCGLWLPRKGGIYDTTTLGIETLGLDYDTTEHSINKAVNDYYCDVLYLKDHQKNCMQVCLEVILGLTFKDVQLRWKG